MDNPVEVVDQNLLREQIRDFVKTNFLYDGDLRQLSDDASFLAEGVVDSTGVLELVLFVEETYGFSVDRADLLPENFDSVSNLTAYISRRLAEE